MIAALLVTSVLFLYEVSKQPHIAFVSERIADDISGQNYTQSTLSTYDGRGLPYGSTRMWEAYYLNDSGFVGNGTFFTYFFQDEILKFNNTTLAVTAYSMLAGHLTEGNTSNTANGTYRGFSYTYMTESQKIYENYGGITYYWGAWGYSGNIVFEVTGESPLPSKTNMSIVAMDQINAMTSFSF